MFINDRLLGFASGHINKIIETCLLQLAMTALGTLVSVGIAFIVRMIQGEERILFFDEVWQVAAFIVIVIALRFVVSKARAITAENCSLGIKTSLRKRLLKKLYDLGPAYTSRERTGSITSTIASKVEFLNEYYTIYLPAAVSAIINAVVIIVVVYVFDPVTAVICIVACAGLLGCPMVFYFLMRRRGAEESEAHSSYYSDCLDSLQGMATLKAFNANARQREIIYAKGEGLRRAVMALLRITMLENVVLQFFAGLGSAFSIAIAAYQCANGAMDQKYLVYTLFLISACFTPMQALINAWHMGYRGVTASYNIDKLLQEAMPRSIRSTEDHGIVGASTSQADGIIFDHVSFAYNEQDGNVLCDVSFTVPKKTSVALVGPSGSGKSTIAQLLDGFYSASRGMISADGVKLTPETVNTVQDKISAVWQDCHVFYGTVADNIRMGRPDASMEEVISAAKKANIHEFISCLPNGYDTMIGERGMRFSGGERQRIVLARAFLRDAPIIILDEATSSLDRKNEMAIQESFEKISKEKTALIIAHRLATIQNADQIIIMEKGRISAYGTHDELLAASESYRTLMGNQVMEGKSHET